MMQLGRMPLPEITLPTWIRPFTGGTVMVIWLLAKLAVKVTALTVRVVEPAVIEAFRPLALVVSVSREVD